MFVNFSKIDTKESPTLILKNSSGKALGVLNYAIDVEADLKYNEVSSLSFTIPQYVEGKEIPAYKSTIGKRIVEIKDVAQFILMNPEEFSDGIRKEKRCKGYSLEYEFSSKKISLPNYTYNLYDPKGDPNDIVSMILSRMPAWSLGDISDTLHNKFRTFEISDENLYNFMKGKLQETYGCIFDFNTITMELNIRDVSEFVDTKPVYISLENLAKSISITENTEGIITQLDVNGADGVDIRDVNPMGNNKIINLDYFMVEDNFDQVTIEKYFDWKDAVQNSQESFYSLSIQLSIKTMEETSEEALLADLKFELTGLENELAATIQAFNQGAGTQSDIDDVNVNISIKKSQISTKESYVNTIKSEIANILNDMSLIKASVSFESFFTSEELLSIDRYIIEDSVADNSFAVHSSNEYNISADTQYIDNIPIQITDTTIEAVSETENPIYKISGGQISVLNKISAKLISGVIDGTRLVSLYLGKGTVTAGGTPSEFSNATFSISGDMDLTFGENSVVGEVLSGSTYFTTDISEYERKMVAWDLYAYGQDVLNKLSQPTFSFSVDSSNFFSLSEFKDFKNKISLGQKVYLGIEEGVILEPISIGVAFKYGIEPSMQLYFGDKYSFQDSDFYLTDLFEKSISMGKNLELKQFSYSSFTSTGANTEVKNFMNSAIDVAKNNILSSSSQAVSWDGSGLRLRKYLTPENPENGSFEDEQIWMNNNSIMMTGDSWQTAEIAIGKFKDSSGKVLWGIVAPNIVGTMLAGENLIIESEKQDGGTSVFKIDEDGCSLYNSSIELKNGNSHIVLDPDIGMVMGVDPVYTVVSGEKVINTENSKFWADEDGNLHLKGILDAAEGTFTGRIIAESGNIKGRIDLGIPMGSPEWTGPSIFYIDGTEDFSTRIFSYNTDTQAGFVLSSDGEVVMSQATMFECSIGECVIEECSIENCTIDRNCTILGTLTGNNISSNIGDYSKGTITYISDNRLQDEWGSYIFELRNQREGLMDAKSDFALYVNEYREAVTNSLTCRSVSEMRSTNGGAGGSYKEAYVIAQTDRYDWSPGTSHSGVSEVYVGAENIYIGTGSESIQMKNGYSSGRTEGRLIGEWVFGKGYLANPVFEQNEYSGESGCIKIASIKILQPYADTMIGFVIARRGVDFSDVRIRFDGAEVINNNTIAEFKYTGGDISAWCKKASSDTWDIYIQKGSPWDAISVLDLKYPEYMRWAVNITWPNTFHSGVPSGSVQAVR